MTTVVNKNGVEFDIDAIASDLNMKLEKDLVNITDAGKVRIAHNSSPSLTEYQAVSVGANNTVYEAPADGSFYAYGSYNYSGAGTLAYIALYDTDKENIGITIPLNVERTIGFGIRNRIDVAKGGHIMFSYQSVSNPALYFVPKVGSESEA